jgi:hypothetical protein
MGTRIEPIAIAYTSVRDTPSDLGSDYPGHIAVTLNPLTVWVFTLVGWQAVGTPSGDAPPAPASESGAGTVELATQAEVESGAAGNLVATAARLKAELDRRINPLTAAPTWTAPTLTSGWTNAAGYQAAQYAKDAQGFVVLRGNVTGGSTGSGATILTLPAGFRPAANERFATASAAGTATIEIQTDGRVVPFSATGAQASLSGIRFWPV